MAQAAHTRGSVDAAVRTRTDCRLCGSTALTTIWEFGSTPLANAYVTPEEAAQSTLEVFAPLTVTYCTSCHLVQLKHVVDPAVLFRYYLYVSSTSPSFVAHFEQYAATVTKRLGLAQDSLVVDVGSNDGILLKPFKKLGMRVLGIDPAENIAREATAAGIPTEAAFFTPDVAQRLHAQHGPAAVITANNVFAHTDDVPLFVDAVKTLLAPDGAFIFEVQYLKDLVEQNLFDIVYHEHLCYYSLHPLQRFFAAQGMELFDVEHVAAHGGSIRVYVSRKASPGRGTPQHQPTPRLKQMLADEQQAGLLTLAPYQAFAERITANKEALRTLLTDLKAQGKRIVGFGAPAKATTLLYAFGIDGSLLDYIVDDAPLKQGRVMPGSHIPIYSPATLYGEGPHAAKAPRGMPDYCVILAWNFAEPIMRNHQRFAEQGGRFIIPVPEPKVVNTTSGSSEKSKDKNAK